MGKFLDEVIQAVKDGKNEVELNKAFDSRTKQEKKQDIRKIRQKTFNTNILIGLILGIFILIFGILFGK
jgi:uncharacterized membrane protein